MTVTAWRGGQLKKKWSGRTFWKAVDGTFIAVMEGRKLQWVRGEAVGVQVETDERGLNGIPLTTWIPHRANMIKVVVSRHGFGENPTGGVGKHDATRRKSKPRAPALQPSRTQTTQPVRKTDNTDAILTGEAQVVRVAEVNPSPNDSPDDEPAADTTAQPRRLYRGKSNRRPRTIHRRARFLGLGSEKGRPDGDHSGHEQGRPHELGGVPNAYGSTLTGESFGDPEGATGGDGKRGDAGARGALGWLGIINIPRAYRAAAEVAILGADVMSPSAAFRTVLRSGVRRASILTIRRKMRRQARRFAKGEVKRLKAQFAEGLKQMAKKEREHLLLATKHQKQSQYFEKVEIGARNRQRHLEKKLDESPGDRRITAELNDARKVEEAAAVRPVEGRLPLNHEYAGKVYLITNINATRHPRAVADIRGKNLRGVQFSKEGFPDFGPWAYKRDDVVADVRITYTGRKSSDFTAARNAMREKLGDPGWKRDATLYTWHHHEEVGRMVLVPKQLHDAVGHTGGVPHYRMQTGKYDEYR